MKPKIVFKIFYDENWYDLSDYITDFGLTEDAFKILPENFWDSINQSSLLN